MNLAKHTRMVLRLFFLLWVTVCSPYGKTAETKEADLYQPLIRTAVRVRLELGEQRIILREHVTLGAAKNFEAPKFLDPSLADIWSCPLVLHKGSDRSTVLFADPPVCQSLRSARVGKLLRLSPEKSNFPGGIYSLPIDFRVLAENGAEEITFSYSTKGVPSATEFRLEYQPIFENKEYMPPVFFDTWAYELEIDTAGRFTVEKEGGKLIEKGGGIWITKIKSDEPIKLTFRRSGSGK
jgi:hypothetical protein